MAEMPLKITSLVGKNARQGRNYPLEADVITVCRRLAVVLSGMDTVMSNRLN